MLCTIREVSDVRNRVARRLIVSTLGFLAAIVVAGCASDGDEAEPGTGSETTATTTATTTTTEPSAPPASSAELPLTPFSRLDGVTSVSEEDRSGEELEPWQEAVSRIEDVRVESTEDGSEQPALWLSPGEQRPAPLLVVVHSWSSGYLQNADIPLAAWAEANEWAMIAPDFRGANLRPESTGSDLAVQDVVDAVDFAVSEGDVDEERVLIIGYSGGGMMSLLAAARHPDLFAGAASWVPRNTGGRRRAPRRGRCAVAGRRGHLTGSRRVPPARRPPSP
jgi:pimeloyl-ACP methyl ester carboxylesterase